MIVDALADITIPIVASSTSNGQSTLSGTTPGPPGWVLSPLRKSSRVPPDDSKTPWATDSAIRPEIALALKTLFKKVNKLVRNISWWQERLKYVKRDIISPG